MNASLFQARNAPPTFGALALIATLFTSSLGAAPAAAQGLPPLFDFFAIATPAAKNPKIDNYDDSWMITGPVHDSASRAGQGENWLQLEGRVIHAYWRFAPGDSGLQVQRGLEKAAAEQGYELVYSCRASTGDCFSSDWKGSANDIGLLVNKLKKYPALDDLNMQNVELDMSSGDGWLNYLRKENGESTTHMQIALSDNKDKGVLAITRTVITGDEPELTGAASMAEKLKSGESVTLDNLLFETDSAILLPNSRDQIFEIAMMMREDPVLKLQIIGHTDSDGGKAHNQDLSERRAASVVDALVNGFDLEASRLTSSGRGMDQPVASNDTAAGKAQNRRVELKLQ